MARAAVPLEQTLRPQARRLPLKRAALIVALCACGEADFSDRERELLSTLTSLYAAPSDPSNRVHDSPAAIALGHALYYDPAISGPIIGKDALGATVPNARGPVGAPSGVSCSTCHDLGAGGVDRSSVPRHVSVGPGWTATNATSVVNAVYYDLHFWNGRADSLWGMLLPVIESPGPINGNRVALARHVTTRHASLYAAAFEARIFGAELPMAGGKPGAIEGCQKAAGEPFDDAYDCLRRDDQRNVTEVAINAVKALAAFVGTLVSIDSTFDRHLRGEEQMSPAAVRGARLFVGRAGCVECHSGAFFTDQGFHNIGVPQIGEGVPTEAACVAGLSACDCVTPQSCQPWGALDGLPRLQGSNLYRRDGPFADGGDSSRARHYDREIGEALKGAWRTPTLRNVALTAPYMHNGAYATLEEVVEHYDRGGTSEGAAPHAKSGLIQPLLLEPQEKADLVEFLRALTGPPLPAEVTRAPPG